jgi:hypothetical protein
MSALFCPVVHPHERRTKATTRVPARRAGASEKIGRRGTSRRYTRHPPRFGAGSDDTARIGIIPAWSPVPWGARRPSIGAALQPLVMKHASSPSLVLCTSSSTTLAPGVECGAHRGERIFEERMGWRLTLSCRARVIREHVTQERLVLPALREAGWRANGWARQPRRIQRYSIPWPPWDTATKTARRLTAPRRPSTLGRWHNARQRPRSE